MTLAPAPSAATVATTADTPTASRSVEKSPQMSNAPLPDAKRAKTAPSGVMSGIGESDKRNFARTHAKALFNEMVRTTSHPANPANPPATFDQLTGAQLCTRQPHERFAGWLTDVENGYKYRDGFEADGKTPKFSMLMASTCDNYIQDLMHSVRIRFSTSGSPEEKLFLQCTVKVNYHHHLLLVSICVPTACFLACPPLPSNLYHSIMRSPSFGLPSPNQITPPDLRARIHMRSQPSPPKLEKRVTQQLSTHWPSFKALRQRYADSRFEQCTNNHLQKYCVVQM